MLFLGNWLRAFGSSFVSSLVFVAVVKCALIALVALWTRRLIPAGNSLDRVSVLLLLATAPPVLLHVLPANNEMAAFLSMCGLVLAFLFRSPYAYAAAGVLLAMAAYTNFFHVYLVLSATLLVALVRRAWPSLSGMFLLGLSLTCGVFTWLGYYPWLTLLVGAQREAEYRSGISYDLLTSVLEYSYLGAPLLIVLGVSLLRSLKSVESALDRRWMVAILLAIGLGAYHMYGVTVAQRYLIGFFFLLTPLVVKFLSDLGLRRSQAYVIPLSNLGFTFLVTFL